MALIERKDLIGDWIRDNHHRYTTRKDMRHALVRATLTTYKYAGDRIARMMNEGAIPNLPFSGPEEDTAPEMVCGDTPPPAADVAPALTLEDFRRQYDHRDAIRRTLAGLAPGRIYVDQDFRALCGVPGPEWRRFADQKEFDLSRLRVKGVWHWAKPETIAEMRAILGV